MNGAIPKSSSEISDLSSLFNEEGLSAGLGLRREILNDLIELGTGRFDFFEIAPENWIEVGGRYRRMLDRVRENAPITLHGLSLNLGGYAPLDKNLLLGVKNLMRDYDCPLYSEHMSYCADDAQIYDLLPIPFTEDAARSTADRISQAQDFLGQTIALENSSYYTPLANEMSELEFICELVNRSGCDLLLDVNNVYVNAINHQYDPYEFISGVPKDRVRYMHVAGHYVESEDLRVDTHGSDVIEPVFELLGFAYERFGIVPTLLERDFNFPPILELAEEVARVRKIQDNSRGNYE